MEKGYPDHGHVCTTGLKLHVEFVSLTSLIKVGLFFSSAHYQTFTATF